MPPGALVQEVANKWYVHTVIDARPVWTLKAEIRALT